MKSGHSGGGGGFAVLCAGRSGHDGMCYRAVVVGRSGYGLRVAGSLGSAGSLAAADIVVPDRMLGMPGTVGPG